MRSLLIVLAAAVVLSGCNRRVDMPDPHELSCHIGVYRLADGTLVDVAPTDDPRLRWRKLDGTFGRLTKAEGGGWTSTLGLTDRPDGVKVGFGGCANGRITFAGQTGARVPLTIGDTRFTSGEETLFGRLVLPVGDAPVPVVVMVHGSEKTAASIFNYRQRLYPAEGVGVFVYDKRGTGQSSGRYSQDFHRLSDDAAAALKEARKLAGARAGRVGFEAGSQGGWVAPLAASKVRPDFIVVGYGLAEGTLAEDREEVMLGLREKGHGPEVLKKAREVTDATGEIMRSDYRNGWDALKAVSASTARKPGSRTWKASSPASSCTIHQSSCASSGRCRMSARAGNTTPCPCCGNWTCPCSGCWPPKIARRRSPRHVAGWWRWPRWAGRSRCSSIRIPTTACICSRSGRTERGRRCASPTVSPGRCWTSRGRADSKATTARLSG